MLRTRSNNLKKNEPQRRKGAKMLNFNNYPLGKKRNIFASLRLCGLLENIILQ